MLNLFQHLVVSQLLSFAVFPLSPRPLSAVQGGRGYNALNLRRARHAELVSASHRWLLRPHRSAAVHRFYRNEVIQRFLWEGRGEVGLPSSSFFISSYSAVLLHRVE